MIHIKNYLALEIITNVSIYLRLHNSIIHKRGFFTFYLKINFFLGRILAEIKSGFEYFPRVKTWNANIFAEHHTFYIRSIDFHFFVEETEFWDTNRMWNIKKTLHYEYNLTLNETHNDPRNNKLFSFQLVSWYVKQCIRTNRIKQLLSIRMKNSYYPFLLCHNKYIMYKLKEYDNVLLMILLHNLNLISFYFTFILWLLPN